MASPLPFMICPSLPFSKSARHVFLATVCLCCAMLWIAPTSAEDDYITVTGPCNFEFPADHAAHPGYRTEWWYYTGNLESKTGHKFGFQLTFFRSQISPPGAYEKWPKEPSRWRTQQLFLAHAAVTDIDGKNFYHAETMSRGALGMAGTTQHQHRISIFLNDWSADIEPDKHSLAADTDHFSFRLTLKPQKPPVAHGDAGYSMKGKNAHSSSCYYSMTRLKVDGLLLLKEKSVEVAGLAWMDHEFSSAPLEPDLTGWDWFSLQLNNDTELMIYLLRKNDGTYSSASSGTLVEPNGQATHLPADNLSITILDTWKSPASGATYPAKWRIQIPPLRTELTIIPNLANQEMRTPETTRVTYWEGSVSASGYQDGKELSGTGYVELTGYAGAFDAPM